MGFALTLVCALYFLQSLLTVDLERIRALPIDGLLAGLALSTLVYTGLLIGVATGFAHLVQATGYRAATASEGVIVWGQANLAKYLPGNVLHFAGRQVLGARRGWPQASIAAASLLEVGLFVLLSGGLAGLALAATGDLGLIDHAHWLALAMVAAALGLAAMLFSSRLTPWLPRPVARLLARLALSHPAAILPALVYFMLFFVGMSLITWVLYELVVDQATLADLPLVIGTFLLSWLLGFVIPGAPGGIGVREGTFVLVGGVLLGGVLPGQESLVIVALSMRLVTLAGEGLLFLVASGVTRDLHTAVMGQIFGRELPRRGSPWRGRASWLPISLRQTNRERNR